MTWLARRYSPEQRDRMDRASRRTAAPITRRSSGTCSTIGLEEAWAQWIADERTFQLANLAAIRKYPITPYRDVTSRALGSVSRAYLRSGVEEDLRRLQLPRRRRARRRHRHRERRGAAHPADQGSGDLHRHVAGVGSGCARVVLHGPTTVRFATWCSSIRPPAGRRCCRRTRASATSSSARATRRCGESAISTASSRSSGSRNRTRRGNRW